MLNKYSLRQAAKNALADLEATSLAAMAKNVLLQMDEDEQAARQAMLDRLRPLQPDLVYLATAIERLKARDLDEAEARDIALETARIGRSSGNPEVRKLSNDVSRCAGETAGVLARLTHLEDGLQTMQISVDHLTARANREAQYRMAEVVRGANPILGDIFVGAALDGIEWGADFFVRHAKVSHLATLIHDEGAVPSVASLDQLETYLRDGLRSAGYTTSKGRLGGSALGLKGLRKWLRMGRSADDKQRERCAEIVLLSAA